MMDTESRYSRLSTCHDAVDHLFSGQKLVGHFPLCGGLRMVTACIKHCANKITTGWDDEINDTHFRRMLTETLTRIEQDDPIRGDWYVDRCEFTAWVDANSLATGIAIEANRSDVKDVSWL